MTWSDLRGIVGGWNRNRNCCYSSIVISDWVRVYWTSAARMLDRRVKSSEQSNEPLMFLTRSCQTLTSSKTFHSSLPMQRRAGLHDSCLLWSFCTGYSIDDVLCLLDAVGFVTGRASIWLVKIWVLVIWYDGGGGDDLTGHLGVLVFATGSSIISCCSKINPEWFDIIRHRHARDSSQVNGWKRLICGHLIDPCHFDDLEWPSSKSEMPTLRGASRSHTCLYPLTDKDEIRHDNMRGKVC